MNRSFFQHDRAALAVILFLFAVYAGIFIYQTSVVVDGTRYFTLFDDGMISMRYARNLAEGNGLVMNPGERVEGITNPLWACYMAAVHFLPVPQEKVSLVIQITGALLLMLNLLFVMKIAGIVSNGSPAVKYASVFLTAFYLPLINWSLQGMEVSAITLLLSVVVWLTFQSFERERFCPVVYVLLGIGTLIRIDMAVPLGGIMLFCAMAQPAFRKKHLLWGMLAIIVFLGGQTVLRAAYYGELLPNTYYLKMTGYPILLRLTRGLYVFWMFIWRMTPLLFIVPFAVAFVRSRYTGILGWLIALQMLYSVYVGGDAWDDWGGSNRYIAIVMPQFLILLVIGLYRIADTCATYVNAGKTAGVRTAVFTALAVTGFALLNNNEGSLSLRGFVFLERPLHTQNNREMVERAALAKKLTKPEAHIAVTWAGIIPYFSERYTVDILGKTDKTIARLPMRTVPEGENPYTYFLPGHLKYDYDYSLGTLKPDIILQVWENIGEADDIIARDYVRAEFGGFWVYARTDSPHVRWDYRGQ